MAYRDETPGRFPLQDCAASLSNRTAQATRPRFDAGWGTEEHEHTMNAETLIKSMTPTPALAKRVRAPVTGDTGTVIDVDADGWVYWFSDDPACHVSRPDWLEVLS